MAGDEEDVNIWQEILEDARTTDSDALRKDGTVIILGDVGCGKTTLVSRMKQVDYSEIAQSLAMDYSYIDIIDEEEEEYHLMGRVNVWQLSGDAHFVPLLKVGMDQPASTVFLICLDYGKPWDLMHSLRKWLKAVENTVANAEFAPGVYEDLQEARRLAFRSYKDPTPAYGDGEGSADADEADADVQGGDAEQILLPLTEGALTTNLGIPIIVSVNMSDQVSNLQSQYAYKDAHFDYIQHALRTVCLEYGAMLVYTSAKENVNTDVIMQYLRHLLYEEPFEVPPSVSEKDRVVVPAGWDTLTNLQVLQDSAASLTRKQTADGEVPGYADIIKKPFQLLSSDTAREQSSIEAEDDQAFLQKYREFIEQHADEPADGGAGTGILNDLLKKGPVGSLKATGRRSSVENLLAQAGASTDSLASTASAAAPSAAAPAAAAGIKAGADDAVLSNFFSNLMSKGGSAAGAAATPSPSE